MKTRIMILGTLHSIHKDNKYYNYNDIYSIIDKYNPDMIGLEIRKEDILQERKYLEKFYPYEMIETKFKYINKSKVFGFDWLGDSINDKLIPNDYFTNLEVKKLEKILNTSNDYYKEKTILDIIDEIKFPLVINHTAQECNNGKYDLLAEVQYTQLSILFKNTPFEKMSHFYKKRNEEISNNIIKTINNNMGKRIIVLTGLDHRIFIIKALKNYFNNDEIVIDDIIN